MSAALTGVASHHVVDGRGDAVEQRARMPSASGRRRALALTLTTLSAQPVHMFARSAVAEHVPIAGSVDASADARLGTRIVLAVVARMLSVESADRPAFEAQLNALDGTTDLGWREIGMLVRSFGPAAVAACRCQDVSEETVMRQWQLAIACVPSARHLVARRIPQLRQGPSGIGAVGATDTANARADPSAPVNRDTRSSAVTPIDVDRRRSSDALAHVIADAVIHELRRRSHVGPVPTRIRRELQNERPLT